MNTIPPIIIRMLIMFNLSIGSLRNIHAEMHTKNMAVDPIIFLSPIGICLNAQLPMVIPAEPRNDRAINLTRFPFGKRGCFLEYENRKVDRYPSMSGDIFISIMNLVDVINEFNFTCR